MRASNRSSKCPGHRAGLFVLEHPFYLVASLRVLRATEGGKSGMTITIAERIKNFLIEHEGMPYCYLCIAGQLGLRGRQQAQQATLAFGNAGNFLRGKGLCFECNNDRLVIRFSK
jgi:hypothetical protein